MQHSMSCVFWQPLLDSVFRAADALLLITVGWVGLRLRSTSRDVQQTSLAQEATLTAVHQLLGRNESVPGVPDPRK